MKGLRRSLGEVCAGLGPASVPLPEVCQLWSSFDVLERLAAGAKCRLAARVAQSRTWQDKGERSPAEWMAHTSGTTTGCNRVPGGVQDPSGPCLPLTPPWPAVSCPTSRPRPSAAQGADPADEARLLLQRSALEARGYRCEVPGCGTTRGLEIDHAED